ncbi:apolipoprotein N-acyltransferase [Herbiconiux sp. SYSU D00978]|uniref:apolipoprotein N-acyltransferase n=1 Tax=Herbiconiux sp. SYSU D00978 TaxID=2812562 RepID=UPI001A9777D7|nr:apolipoprotein N-acyltransferase [Herbiconiux sp. SYSU D00978]
MKGPDSAREPQSGLPLWGAIVLAISAGPVLDAAFPDRGWWPMLFVGLPAMLLALVGRTFRQGFLVGLLGGFSFLGIHIEWITVYLGPLPWIGLNGVESLFYGLGGGLIALVYRYTRHRRGAWVQLGLVPALVAGIWTTREAVSSTFPYGGFAWARMAQSQSESPLRDLAAYVGTSGLSFLLVFVCAAIVQFLVRRDLGAPLRAAVAVGAAAALFAVPAWSVTQTGTMRVVAVQGDSDAGLFAEYTPGEILLDHWEGSRAVEDAEDVDLVVWPENASDLDPLRNPDAARLLDDVTERFGVPLLAGTITVNPDDEIFNSMLLWQDGEVLDQYDKIHPVPFAEYLPNRDLFYPLAPELFDLVPRDYTFGTRDNVVDVDGVTAGVAICFDIVDDELIRQMVADGADVILAPTNNADFGRTDESIQQLAIARLRAIETGRSVVNISTVGTSAIIAPDGTTIRQLPTFEPGQMVEDVPLSDTVTPATALGRLPELAAGAFGLVGLLLAGLRFRREGGEPVFEHTLPAARRG